MANGRRIDDHKFWAGAPSKGSVFPEGVHVKNEVSEEGAGHLANYPDTSEDIVRVQAMNKSKAKAHAQPDLRRN